MKLLNTLLVASVVASAAAAAPSGMPTPRKEMQWGGGGGTPTGPSPTTPPTEPQPRTQVVEQGQWSLSIEETALESDTFKVSVTVDANTWCGVALVPSEDQGGNNAMEGAISVLYQPGSTPEVSVRELTSSGPAGEVAELGSITEVTSEQVDGKSTFSFVASKIGSLPLVPSADTRLLLAHGEEGSNQISYHGPRKGFATFLPFVDVEGETPEIPAIPLSVSLSLHIVFMLLAWGFLVPGGVLSVMLRGGRYPSSPAWFMRHRALVFLGFLLGAIGSIVIIVEKVNVGSPHNDKHFIIGFIVLLFSAVNVVLGMMRPAAASAGEQKLQVRVWWEFGHRAVGSIAMLLGLLNIVFGSLMVFVNENAPPSYALFGSGSVNSSAFGSFLIAVPALAFCALCYGGYKKQADLAAEAEEDKAVQASMA